MVFSEDWYSNDQCNTVAGLAKDANTDGYFIEIGVWQGKSASAIARAIDPLTLLCVDTWRGNEDEIAVTGQGHATVEYAQTRDIFQEFLSNMAELGITNFQPYKLHWKDFFDFLFPYGDLKDAGCDTPSDKGISFLHIDASHDYESVKQCIERALPLMIPGSIMCGDDYLTASDSREDLKGGVMRAVKEMLPGHTNVHNLWIWRKP